MNVESIMTCSRAARTPVLMLVALLALWVGGHAPVSAQAPSEFAGAWKLNHQLSQFPQELGFSASFLPPAEPGGGGGGGSGGGGRGGRRAREGGDASLPPRPPRPPTTTAEDSARVRFLTDEVRLPPERLTIQVTPATVTITPDRGAPRTLQPGRRDESVTLGPVTAVTNTGWDAGHLVVVYRAEANRLL